MKGYQEGLYPILDYDPQADGVILPKARPANQGVSGKVLLCFFTEAMEALYREGLLELAFTFPTEMGIRPVYKCLINGQEIHLIHPGCGAPYAAITMERMIAWGARQVLALGGAGVIAQDQGLGSLMIPLSAIRDEGTSYHYLPPSSEIELSREAGQSIAESLKAQGVNSRFVKTWTTDGFFRETPERIRRRVEQGAQAVEMECAAFSAVAQVRQVAFAQILYSGDSLTGPEWDHRNWMEQPELRKILIKKSCLALADWQLEESLIPD